MLSSDFDPLKFFHSNNDSTPPTIDRRTFLKVLSTVFLSTISISRVSTPLLAGPKGSGASNTKAKMKTRTIPVSGEEIPVVGLGTWQQFDVPEDYSNMDLLRKVLSNLFQMGGSLIDTSPMYGRAEAVLGNLLDSKSLSKSFIATKVWTRGRKQGKRQMRASMNKLRTNTIDLMQIHNLLDWETHLPVLRNWKKQGQIRYIGVTHYTGSAFEKLFNIMKKIPLDFVQLPYSIAFRRAERRLLPLADERDIAVVVNRPFQAGRLFHIVEDEKLPEWVKDFDCHSWAQFFLKFILGHPAVTCVIPGTSDPQHMLDNARAGVGSFPSNKQRDDMVRLWDSL